MVAEDAGDKGGPRFGHLLKPIRDLADNWNINVASELEEYLQEIEGVKFSFDGSEETFNFAEAALLIQGSACIYSKKVEYLYSLVYETLDLLASKRRLAQGSSLNDDGTDVDAAAFAAEDSLEQFLSLDDIREEKNLNLKEGSATMSTDADVVQRTPVALIPLAEGERVGDAQLVSAKGNVIGNRSDFRMNTSIVHPSGALLLGVDGADLVDHSFQAPVHSTPFARVGAPRNPAGGEGLPSPPPADDYDEPDLGGMDDDSDNGHDDGAGGNDFAGDDESFDPILGGMNTDETADKPKTPARAAPPAAEQKGPEPINPWKQLDPHGSDDTGGSRHSQANPFRKIKMFRVPSSLVETTTKKKRKRGKAKKEASLLAPISQFCEEQFLRLSTRSLPRGRFRGPAYPEFQELFWKEQKRRSEARRRDRQALLTVERPPENCAVSPLAQRAVDPQELSMAHVGDGADSDYDDPDLGFDAFGGGDGDDDGGHEEEAYMMQEVAAQHQEYGPISLNVDDDLQVAAGTMPYEELVRQHIERYVSEVDRYALKTDLSRRVKTWEERILPILEAEDTHPAYDIHQYGDEVLSSFPPKISSSNCTQTFDEVVRTTEPYQVCRMFLATLQLANLGNIEIISSSEGVDDADWLVKILTRRRQQQENLAGFNMRA